MTTEQLLEQIKALPEIEFANLMRELKSHIEVNALLHCFEEAGMPTLKYVEDLEEGVEDMEEEVEELKSRALMAEASCEIFQKEIEELKEKLAQYESEQL